MIIEYVQIFHTKKPWWWWFIQRNYFRCSFSDTFQPTSVDSVLVRNKCSVHFKVFVLNLSWLQFRCFSTFILTFSKNRNSLICVLSLSISLISSFYSILCIRFFFFHLFGSWLEKAFRRRKNEEKKTRRHMHTFAISWLGQAQPLRCIPFLMT